MIDLGRRFHAEGPYFRDRPYDDTRLVEIGRLGLAKGTLFVCVDSSVWLSEIVRYRRKEILDRLQHSFGRQTICRISFRVG